MNKKNRRRIAIACQGTGRIAPFAAGVLKELLKEEHREKYEYEIVALSGTSDGAICALFAWYGLLMNDRYKAIELLDSFWRDSSVTSFWDTRQSDALIWANRSEELSGGLPRVDPYLQPSWGQEQLKTLLEKYVDFQRIEELIEPSSPMLYMGAVD